MHALSLISLCCFIAAAAATLTELDELVLDAQCAADDSIPHMDAVEAKMQAFLDSAQELFDAASGAAQLTAIAGDIDGIFGQAENLEGYHRTEYRAALGNIKELRRVPKSLGGHYDVMRNKLERAMTYVTELRTDFPEYRETVDHDEECHDCVDVITGCTTCDGDECIACTDDTILSADGSECQACGSVYEDCVACSGGLCTECASNYILSVDGSECQACGSVYEHCVACSGGVCTQCTSNTVLTVEGVCDEVLTNLALNRPVSHDSNFATCHVTYANDGHKSAVYTSNCNLLRCEHTNCNAGPHWLAIDLEAEREFSHVIILNREGPAHARLRNVVVYTAASMPSLGQPLPAEVTRCGTYDGILDEAVFSTIQCDSVVTGRYVIIAMPNAPSCFTVCEVEIYNAPCYNLPALDHAVTSYNKYECTDGRSFSSTSTPFSPEATCTLVNRGPTDEIAFDWTNVPAGNCVL